MLADAASVDLQTCFRLANDIGTYKRIFKVTPVPLAMPRHLDKLARTTERDVRVAVVRPTESHVCSVVITSVQKAV